MSQLFSSFLMFYLYKPTDRIFIIFLVALTNFYRIALKHIIIYRRVFTTDLICSINPRIVYEMIDKKF